MPIYQKMISMDELFNNLSIEPIIINDLPNQTEEDKKYINDTISSRYNSDMISLLPSCRCGELKGEYSVGVVCGHCNTPVRSNIQEEIEPSIWFASPRGVEKIISPIALILLRNRFEKSNFDVIQWLMDSSYAPAIKQPKVMERIKLDGLKRGYNNFVQNFDSIIAYLLSLKDFKLNRKQRDYLVDFLTEYRHILFSDYIPLPNKSILIIENTNVGKYVVNETVEAIDAINMLVSIDKDFYDQNPKTKENRTAKALCKLADFYIDYMKNSISKDVGQFRKHIVGSRVNFSFRGVISSITDPHEYDELHLPWGIGLTAFKPHLTNKLVKLGFSSDQASGYLLSHVERYDPLLEKLLNELISESRDGSIPVIFARNPSLMQGSTQLQRITKFKTNPNDKTIGLPILLVRGFNAESAFYI